jgi:fermentation-respiration switch protein FrsA (DUF1100 family)
LTAEWPSLHVKRMNLLKIFAVFFVIVYCGVMVILYTLQTKLIFFPGKLLPEFTFKLGNNGQEVFLNTIDGERINALFFRGSRPDVVLYFHGNAGDLSGWQFVAEDFTSPGYNFLIVDYRGYGKSSGMISEKGLYLDGEAAFNYLVENGFTPANILVYGRSIGSGVAVDLASKQPCKGLILEAPHTSLTKLADEKFPFFFPSLYLKYKFDNIRKINKVKCPVIFIHGADDSLIPASHTEKLFKKFTGRKKKIIIPQGSHNDLHAFPEYDQLLKEVLPSFF